MSSCRRTGRWREQEKPGQRVSLRVFLLKLMSCGEGPYRMVVPGVGHHARLKQESTTLSRGHAGVNVKRIAPLPGGMKVARGRRETRHPLLQLSWFSLKWRSDVLR